MGKRFCQGVVARGLSNFMPLKDVLDKNQGFLKDDKLKVCTFSVGALR